MPVIQARRIAAPARTDPNEHGGEKQRPPLAFEAVKLEKAGCRCLKAASAAADGNETKTHIDR
jgi:hypothetical protein